MGTGPTIAELQRQVRQLKEVLRLSREGNEDIGEMDTTDSGEMVEDPAMESYDVIWNLLDLADMADADLEAAFAKRATLNEDREW